MFLCAKSKASFHKIAVRVLIDLFVTSPTIGFLLFDDSISNHLEPYARKGQQSQYGDGIDGPFHPMEGRCVDRVIVLRGHPPIVHPECQPTREQYQSMRNKRPVQCSTIPEVPSLGNGSSSIHQEIPTKEGLCKQKQVKTWSCSHFLQTRC